jgi:hypothetical protein
MKLPLGSASVLVGAFLGVLTCGSAEAVTLGFGICVSNDDASDCAVASAQIGVEVESGPGLDRVSFRFTNTGPSTASITDVYFDDGTLLGIAGVLNGAGVSFSQGASPGNLPAGAEATPAFVATAGFAADSNPPVQPNGVNPGEELTIVFDLTPGGSYADVLEELRDGRLRVGVHVQGFAGGGSESLINTPLAEADSLLLLGLGLLGLGWFGRRS